MEENIQSSLSSAYLLLLILAAIASVAFTWHDTIVKKNFEIIIAEGGLENVEIEE